MVIPETLVWGSRLHLAESAAGSGYRCRQLSLPSSSATSQEAVMAGPSLLVRQTLRRHGLPALPHLFQHGHLDVLPRTASKPEAFRYSALRR